MTVHLDAGQSKYLKALKSMAHVTFRQLKSVRQGERQRSSDRLGRD